LHAKEIRGKMKENVENKGINDKKASENQFIAFVSLVFGSLIHSLILSYFFTLREILVHSWSTWAITWIGERSKMNH